MVKPVAAMRKSYERGELDEGSLHSHPIDQFTQWFEEARKAGIIEANAMIVSTVDQQGGPSARTVLLKGFDRDGFVFYTNYESQKGRELAFNPAVALTFYWASLERQIRISGTASKVTDVQSDEYFAMRPIGSRIGAAASPQSTVIPSREWLAIRAAELEQQYPEAAGLERPDYWGGYRVTPQLIEFWQGRPDRLHDRLRYRLHDDTWKIERLAP